MSPRERALTALTGGIPDRVPIDYLANPGIDGRLKTHYGLDADDSEGLRRLLNVDFRTVRAPYIGPKLHDDIPDRRIDMWGIRTRWVEHESGGYWDYCDFPLKDATLSEIEEWPLPDPDDFDYSEIVRQCAAYDDYCIIAGDPGYADIINTTGMIRTMERTLMDIMTDEESTRRFIDRRLEVQLEIGRRTLEAAGGRIDVFWLGEDLGTQRGPMISEALYDSQFRERHQRFIDVGRRHGALVMFHSCGSSSWVFERWIEMGVGAIDTLQPEAVNMAPEYLKRTYGDRLAFHGCISTAGPVAYGTADDTARNVRDTLEVMMPGGGYALAPTHLLQDNSPVENVVALYEAALEFGGYD